MSRKYRILKWISLSILSLVAILVSFALWFSSLLPERDASMPHTSAKDLAYLSRDSIGHRGKILAIVTSMDVMGNTDKSTGYELTELARAYYVFEANGFEVDVASPKGGKAPVVLDDEDMGVYDHAFLNDSIAQYKTSHTLAIENVDPKAYQAVFFAGGKGAMFDFPNNKAIQSLVKDYQESDKVIGAVCHGPSALVNVVLDNGQALTENRKVSAFTNKEELLLIPEAHSLFPFLLQDRLIEKGAVFKEGPMYLEQISHDGNLITGQNPWSTWSLAETMVQQMGYEPKYRPSTGEENTVRVLSIYEDKGLAASKETIKSMLGKEQKTIDRGLLARHSIMAVIRGKLSDFYDIIRLAYFVKQYESKKKQY